MDKEFVYSLVLKNIEKRKQGNKAPFMAYYDDMWPEVKECFTQVLRDLVADNRISAHNDVNGHLIFNIK